MTPRELEMTERYNELLAALAVLDDTDPERADAFRREIADTIESVKIAYEKKEDK